MTKENEDTQLKTPLSQSAVEGIVIFSVSSLDRFELKERGTVFIIESPVKADRKHKAMMESLQGKIKIDGIEYTPLGFEWHLPATPVSVGEKIGVLVKI